MVGRAFSVKVDFDLHAVTCPGVWLCPNGKVALQIHIFDSCVATHRLTPLFPLLYHNKFTFKKIFTGVTTLAELEKKLFSEYIFVELIQWSPTKNKNVSLATFNTNLVDLLYPVPCYKGILAGVNVDLLMEPSKFFPGILSPKVEISTRTTIEEVADFDACSKETHLINPKVINSVNQQCIHKKKELLPNKGILRQKKVCHTGQGKQSNYICRICRRQQNNIQVHDCNYDKCSLSGNDQCYLSFPQRRQICSCSIASLQKSCENYNICNDAHILDSCPICLKYKCYFSNEKSDSNSTTKLYDIKNDGLSKSKQNESRTKLFSGINNTIHKCYKSNVPKISHAMHSLNLQNDIKNSNYKIHDEDGSLKHSLLERHKNDSICRTNSAPSLKDDPTTSILLAKIRQLEKTKEKLNYTNCPDGDSNHTPLYDNFQTIDVRKGFYKNLEKFYKRMYKQAKRRAYELGET